MNNKEYNELRALIKTLTPARSLSPRETNEVVKMVEDVEAIHDIMPMGLAPNRLQTVMGAILTVCGDEAP